MESAIKNLKDKSVSRLTVYKHLNLVLECRDNAYDKDCVDTLFEIFSNDLLQGTQNGLNSLVLNSIKLVLDSIELNDETYLTSLENITMTIFKHLIAIVRFPQGQGNQKICWEMISGLPDRILKNVMGSNIKQMTSFISQSLNANIDHPVKSLISRVVLRWLKMFTSEELSSVAADLLNAWFGYTVPAMFIPDENVRNVAVETIELILPHLKNVDYINNPKWMAIMLDLQKKKYTPILLQTFHKKDAIWKNIWCIMLRLLEKDLKKNGLLINSLLPVLEQAFRDETTRKDAFFCWNVLIDVSTSKTNEQNNQKIVKLLCTPLVSNNAKSVEIALAKFKVWWFLVTNLSHEITSYQDIMLYPFLNFCFGNDNSNENIIPGLVFQSLRKFTICSLVEMFGHEGSCSGCVGDRVIHLRKPIVNGIIFNSASKRWLDAVKSAIVVISEQMQRAEEKGKPTDSLKQNLKCIWTSLLKIVTQIANPNLMTATFRNIVKMFDSLCENHQNNCFLTELMIEYLVPSMVEKGTGYSAEFLNDSSNYEDKDESNITPIRALFLILLSPKLQKCVWPETKVLPFKELVCLELDNNLMNFCGWIIIHLTNSEPSLSIWCHLSDALTNPKHSNINDIYEVVLCWPLAVDMDTREVKKIVRSWRELYTFVTQKISTPKKKSLSFFEESLITKIATVSDATVESRLIMSTYFLSSIMKHRAKCNPVGQVTNQPSSLKILHELLGQLKKCNVTDHIVSTVIEAVECVSCVLASYNSRRATPEYLQLLIKTAEKTLKTVNYCLQKTIFSLHSSEYAKKMSDLLPPYLLSTFSTACCQTVSDIILTLVRKNEEDMVKFKDILQQVYKSQSVNAVTEKKIDKLLKDKDTADFKSPQHKDGNGKVKTQKNEVTNSKDDEFVYIKPQWKFDPKKLTEHQKEVLTRRRENIPALYEDLSQSQDDYNMKTWKPSGYTNDETSESSKEHDSSRDKSASRDVSITKENVQVISADEKPADETNTKETNNVLVKKVLRDIPNPGLTDTTNNLSPQNGEIKSNKTAKVSSENVENDNIKLAIVASPKVINKMTSFQSRLERSIKKLQEGSVKLDNISPNAKKMQEIAPNVTTPTAKRPVEDSANVNTTPITKKPIEDEANVNTTPTAKKLIEDSVDVNTTPATKKSIEESSNVNITPSAKKPVNDFDVNVTPVSVKQTIDVNSHPSPVVSKVIHAYVKPVVTSPVMTPQECSLKLVATPPNEGNLKPPETERPMRQRKRPNKFDPDDLRFFGKRRASTSVLDIGRRSSVSDSETSSVTSDSTTNGSKEDDDTTPTKIKKRKMRLLKTLAIDTVDGHPNKEIFVLDKSSRRRSIIEKNPNGPEPKRRRISISNKTGGDTVITPKNNSVKLGPKSKTRLISGDLKISPQNSQELSDSSRESEETTTSTQKVKTVSAKAGPKSKTKLNNSKSKTTQNSQEHSDSAHESSDSAQESAAPRLDSVPASIEIIPPTEVVTQSNDQIIVSSQETPLTNINKLTVSQSEAILISDEPTAPVDESVIVIEPSVSAPIEVTEKLTAFDSESNVFERSPKLATQTVIELSDDDNDVSFISSDLPESQDVIQSSQDSTSNMSVTPRRIIAVINCKSKSSPNSSPSSKKKSESKMNSVIVIPDTQMDHNVLDTADVNTLPVASGASDDVDVAEKSTEAVEPSISTTVEIAEAETEMLEGAETQMQVDESISEDKDNSLKSQPCEMMDVDEIETGNVCEDKKIESEDVKENISVPDDAMDDKQPSKECVEPENSSIINLETDDVKNVTSEEVFDLTDEENDPINRSTILSSPYKDDIDDRNAELLNNTLDISPIKSADREIIDSEDKASTDMNDLESLGCKVLSDNDSNSDTDQANSPSNSRNTSPVVMAEISPINSPRKVSSPPETTSPDEKSATSDNLSPSRGIYSPSGSTNQKKNRPIMSRIGGRAAQMLGLCKRGPADCSDNKFSNVTSLSPVRMIARKNLHSFYGNAASNNDTTDCNTSKNDDDNLLEFSKTLPSPYASPSGPILKKDQSVSPTGKKKRVSFHDPPVSKQLNIEKYIDPPQIVRSPQRVKVTKSYKDEPASFMKQPKVVYCLVKKIDSVEQTVSNLSETDHTESNLSEICSLEADTQQPIELINNDLLDDTQPIFPTLSDCKIPICEIASDLTSESCKDMFLNEVKDEINTIGDLANLTELKVNRLPISFPKISTVKKVLSDFESTLQRIEVEIESERIESEKVEAENTVDNKEQVLEEAVVKDNDTTTECMDVLDVSASKIEIHQECSDNQHSCIDNTHLIDGEHIDFNSDENLIKLLDKILQRKTVATYLSQNIHKYFNVLTPK